MGLVRSKRNRDATVVGRVPGICSGVVEANLHGVAWDEHCVGRGFKDLRRAPRSQGCWIARPADLSSTVALGGEDGEKEGGLLLFPVDSDLETSGQDKGGVHSGPSGAVWERRLRGDSRRNE